MIPKRSAGLNEVMNVRDITQPYFSLKKVLTFERG